MPEDASQCEVKDQVVTARQGILPSISHVFPADVDVTHTLLSRVQSVSRPDIEWTPSTANSSALGLHWNVPVLLRKSIIYKDEPRPKEPFACLFSFIMKLGAGAGRTYESAADHKHIGLEVE
jgi:hypothetical protein